MLSSAVAHHLGAPPGTSGVAGSCLRALGGLEVISWQRPLAEKGRRGLRSLEILLMRLHFRELMALMSSSSFRASATVSGPVKTQQHI